MGGLLWQPVVGPGGGDGGGREPELSLTFEGLGIYFSSSTMNINLSF